MTGLPPASSTGVAQLLHHRHVAGHDRFAEAHPGAEAALFTLAWFVTVPSFLMLLLRSTVSGHHSAGEAVSADPACRPAGAAHPADLRDPDGPLDGQRRAAGDVRLRDPWTPTRPRRVDHNTGPTAGRGCLRSGHGVRPQAAGEILGRKPGHEGPPAVWVPSATARGWPGNAPAAVASGAWHS